MNSVCNKTSNNKYFNSPARMDDGRAFTDYRASSTVDDMIRYSNNVMGSYEYRQFLIHNAVNIMKVNQDYTYEKVGNGTCNAVPVPFRENCDVNKSWARCSVNNPAGIGIKNIVKNQDIYPV